MTDKKTRESQLLELIQDAVNLATVHAKEYGESYKEFEEAWDVLDEEVEEADDDVVEIKNRLLAELWESNVNSDAVNFKKKASLIKKHAKHGIVELLHVIAVCNKIEGMRED